jgi:beta-phosphoglucomutase
MLHFEAYKRMIGKRGFTLNWDLPTYIKAAMFESTGLKKAVYASFPKLYEAEPNWDVLYQEKKSAYLELLREGRLELMPGVAPLLEWLAKEGKRRCVVTHSPLEQIALIRKALPLLDTIPNWITREDYKEAKPHPECYCKAIEKFGQSQDKIIGFEDSPRGLKALLGSSAEGVMVSTMFEYDAIRGEFERDFKLVGSFSEFAP